MKDYVQHVHKFSTINQQRLKKICEPLELLGITTFWYDTMSTDGFFTCLGNQGPVGEFFADSKLYKGHPGFRHPDLSTQALEFPDVLYGIDAKYEATQGVILKKFGSDKTLFIKERKGNVLHVYGFQSTKDHVAMTQVYLNHIHLLKKFIAYFKQEAADILKKMNDNKVHIAPQCGEDFYRILPTDAGYISKKKINNFLAKIGEDDLTLIDIPSFTKRELDCIKWILKGRTAKQTAEELNISKRTVEHYIENMKDKMGCTNKSELIDRLQLMQPIL